MFYGWDRVKCFCSGLTQFFQNNLILLTLTTQTAIFGFLDYINNDSILGNNKCINNHILLTFKLYVYKSREKKLWNLNNLTAEIQEIRRIENEIALPNSNKTIDFTRKWHMIDNIVP